MEWNRGTEAPRRFCVTVTVLGRICVLWADERGGAAAIKVAAGSRALPLGDGDSKDSELCVDVVGDQPRCMDMVSVDDVIRAVEGYYDGGVLPPL